MNQPYVIKLLLLFDSKEGVSKLINPSLFKLLETLTSITTLKDYTELELYFFYNTKLTLEEQISYLESFDLVLLVSTFNSTITSIKLSFQLQVCKSKNIPYIYLKI